MKKSVLLVALLLASTTLISQENSRFEFDFKNVKYQFNDVPTLNLYIGPKTLYKVNFVVAYANNLFTNITLHNRDYKVHNVQLALNYTF